MTTPSIHDLYQMIRDEGKVSFAEIREAFPEVRHSKLRSRCGKLVQQGWVLKLDPSDCYIFVGPRGAISEGAEE